MENNIYVVGLIKLDEETFLGKHGNFYADFNKATHYKKLKSALTKLLWKGNESGKELFAYKISIGLSENKTEKVSKQEIREILGTIKTEHRSESLNERVNFETLKFFTSRNDYLKNYYYEYDIN